MSIFLYIFNNIIKDSDDNITRDSGEYVVSELARKSVIEVYDYLDIPLAELIKKQKLNISMIKIMKKLLL